MRGTIGNAVKGVTIRPGTADWYDASSPRGQSGDPNSGWNLDGMGAANLLVLDENNAHVDHRGLYHYRGVPMGLLVALQDGMVDWAADGHSLYLAPANARPNWRLKQGQRPTPLWRL